MKKNNIKTLLVDVDNTLVPYEQAEPDEKVLAWISSLKNNGIRFAFISNNTSDKRIKRFNSTIGALAFANSGKPFAGRVINKALLALDGKKESAAFMGDQIFTDVCAGKFNGMRAILVPPINDKRDPLTKFKRLLERPVMRKYRKKLESDK